MATSQPATKMVHEKSATKSATPARHDAPGQIVRYVWTMLATMIGCGALYYGLVFGLFATGHLSPPGFSNSVCVDEKLAFMRRTTVGDPNLLVVGSSVAWRHFDGDAARRAAPGTIPYNGGFCGLSANQTAFVADWLLGHHPGISEVLLIASPQDFENCTTTRAAVFNPVDADAYVYGQTSPWLFYLKYFSPAALLRNSLTIKMRRIDEHASDPLSFDRYGSGPLKEQGTADSLVYGRVSRLDTACFDALAELAAELSRDGRRFMVASTPMNPDWTALYDASNQLQTAFSTRIQAVLRRYGGEFWDAAADHGVDSGGFRDAFHLDWSAVAPFTEALAIHFGFARTSVDASNNTAGGVRQ